MSPVSPAAIRRRLKAADLTGLFIEELGWNHLRTRSHHIIVNGDVFVLAPVAEKGGFAIYMCCAGPGERLPLYPIRRKIDRQLSKLAHEHIIIYLDEARKHHIWQWVGREP